jgi:hypothetical protein
MALAISRHDVPIFFAGIDTPGEQQRYAVALIERLFSNIPQGATVVVLCWIGGYAWYVIFDIRNSSRHQYDIIAPDIICRLQLIRAAMHAYGHQWACQLVYNPRP